MKIRNLIGVLIITIILLSGNLLHAASIYYVDSGNESPGNGEGWDTAFKTIQAGIEAANIAASGSGGTPVEVRVMAGVYTPETQGESFVLKPYVKLYGGFGSKEDSFDERNPSANPTILSGDINGDDQWIDSWGVAAVQKAAVVTDGIFKTPETGWLIDVTTATDNSSVVVSIPAGSNLDSNTTLDGFIITGGFKDTAGPDIFGSGIFNEDNSSVITIANCIISGNTTLYTGNGNSNVYGAGISSRYAGNTLNISSCTLQANAIISIPEAGHSRLSGAAIYNDQSRLNLSDCTITGNLALGISEPNYFDIHGVAVYNSGAGSSITNCTISDNMGDVVSGDDSEISGVGLYNDNTGSNLAVSNSTFSNNVMKLATGFDNGDVFGGGICNRGSNSSVSGCTLTGNIASATSEESFINSGGIGLYNMSDNFSVSNCAIDKNSVTVTAKKKAQLDGTGFYNFGDNLTLLNSSASDNYANITSTDYNAEARGGGCHLSSRSAEMAGCSISNNTIIVKSGSVNASHSASCQGGGVFLWNDPHSIINSTISGNSVSVSSENAESSIYGGGIYSDEYLFMVNTTLAGNKAVATSTADDAIVLGGGCYQNSGSGLISLVINSILWGNDISATAMAGTATIGGPQAYDAVVRYSVVEYGYPSGTDIIKSDPALKPLSDNGGPTQTMAIGTGSPALNAGVVCYKDSNNIYFYSVPSTSSYKIISDNSDYAPRATDTILNATDQRGAARPQSYFTDMGSYELGGIYTLTFSTDDSGGGKLSGDDGTLNDEIIQTVNYYHNSSVVAALPAGGFEFTSWTGGHSGTENPLILKNVSADMTLQANFVRVSPDFPIVTTAAATDIDYTSAVVGGDVTGTAWSDVTARGLCYSTAQVPTIDDTKTINGEGTGSFTSTLENLEAGITYYIRAYATNSAGTAYGDQVSFTALSSLPVVETSEISAIGESTAQSGGSVTFDGGLTIISRGVCWSRSEEPTLETKFTIDGDGTGAFTSAMEGLSETTTYYVRAYAINKKGAAYGEQLSFTTAANSQATSGSSSGSGGGCFIGTVNECF